LGERSIPDHLYVAAGPKEEADELFAKFVPLDDSGACLSDFNPDAGVDRTDVQAFFQAWLEADLSTTPLADSNADGEIGGSDVEALFFVWQTSAC